MLVVFVFLSLFLPIRLSQAAGILYLYTAIVGMFFFLSEIRFSRRLIFLFCSILLTRSISFLYEGINFGNSTSREISHILISTFYVVCLNCVFSASLFNRERLFIKMIKSFTICGIILALISIQQMYDLFGINKLYLSLINPSDSRQLQYFLTHLKHRPLGLIGNPNEFGFQLGLCQLASWFGLLNYKNKKIYLIACIFCFIGLILTSSRSSFIFVVIGSLFVLLGSKLTWMYKIFIFSFSSILLFLFFIFGQNSSLLSHQINRVLAILNFSSDRSWEMRITNVWKFNLAWFAKSPIWGVGTLAAIRPNAADNEWFLLLRQWGIVGTIVFASTILTPLFIAWKKKQTPKQNFFLALGLLAGAGLYMIPASFTSSMALYTSWAILYFTALQ